MSDLFNPGWLFDEEEQQILVSQVIEQEAVSSYDQGEVLVITVQRDLPTGWICPVCGRGVAPSEKYCECRR